MKVNRRLLRLGVPLFWVITSFVALAQRQSPPTQNLITAPEAEQRYEEKNLSSTLRKTEATETRPVGESAKGLGRPTFLGTYSPHFVPPLRLQNTDRLAGRRGRCRARSKEKLMSDEPFTGVGTWLQFAKEAQHGR